MALTQAQGMRKKSVNVMKCSWALGIVIAPQRDPSGAEGRWGGGCEGCHWGAGHTWNETHRHSLHLACGWGG